jgi:hypothetical protein
MSPRQVLPRFAGPWCPQGARSGKGPDNCFLNFYLFISSSRVTPLLSIYEQNGRDFNEINLATAIHRIGKNGDSHRSDDPRLRALIEHATLSVARGWKPQQLANVCWATAKMGAVTPTLFEAIAAEARAQMRHFNPQDLANTA